MKKAGNTPSPDEGTSGNRGEGHAPFLKIPGMLVAILEHSGKIIAVFCLAFMFMALLVNVVLRYAFGSGIAWAYEIHALLLPWLVAGGIVIASSRGRHIAISLLIDMLDDEKRRWLLIAIEICLISICISVLWSSQPILRASQFQTLSTLGIKQIWGYSSLIYAFAAMVLISLARMIAMMTGAPVVETNPADKSLS